MTTLTPDDLPSDTAEWLKQVGRKKKALATAVTSMPWAPSGLTEMLDYVEQQCRNAAIARHLGGKK